MANKLLKAKDLRGPSIYQGEKPGTLYYDFLCKEAYIIQNSDANKYDDYKAYLIIAIIVGICACFYGKFNIFISVALVAAIYGIGRFVFQKVCLDKCITVEYKPERKEFFLFPWAREMKMKNLIILVALSIFLLVLCCFNYYNFIEEEFFRIGYIVLSVCIVVFLGFVIAAIIIKLKNKNNTNQE